MARRQSGVQDFLANFNAAFNATRQVGQSYETAQVANAKPEFEGGFTEEQGKEISAAAESGQNHIGYDEAAKAYAVTPKLGENDMGPAVPKMIAQQGTTKFLGKETPGVMSKDQVRAARQIALADVITKYDPEAGMKMQDRLEDRAARAEDRTFNLKEQARTEKAWARDDGIEALDKQLGDEFEQGLLGQDGQRRQPSFSDFLSNQEKRAFMLSQAGYSKEANDAAQKALATRYSKAQLETEERKQALGPAVAAFASGNYAPTMEYLNRFALGGTSKITGIERDKDGSVVMNMVGIDGKPMEPVRTSAEQADAMLRSTVDPSAIYKLSHDNFQRQLQLNQDRRADNADRRSAAADGRAAATHAATMTDRQDLRYVREALGKEANPAASESQIKAYGLGVLDIPGARKENYKVEMGDVTTALGSPAVDREGRPKVDPITGRQMVNRDPKREAEFFQWMRANNITDTNKGLAMFLGQQPQQAAPTTPTKFIPVDARKVGDKMVISSGENKGKTATWDGKGWAIER